ncbi:MAG TPA: ATP-binding protein [Kofleriaceae bacterium]|nr:ATP-binding protein [Kofleriaceae bacterium]
MTKRKSPTTTLRRKALPRIARPPAPKQIGKQQLEHELELRRVALELQNEELRGARAEAESALARYTEVFDFAPIGYATIEHDGTIREVNHAASRLLGCERSRLAGVPFVRFVAHGSLAQFDRLVLQAVAHHTSTEAEELELVGAGSLVPVRMTAGSLERSPHVVMLAFEDISDRRRKERALAETRQALQDANRRKDEFLAMLSHELRNPLSPIRAGVGVLQLCPPGSEPSLEAIDVIDRSTAHLVRLVDDLLDVSRITRGKIELEREPVDFTTVVREVIGDHRHALEERGLVVEPQIADAQIWVSGDRARLIQICSNVIGNAEKFTPRGGRIEIALRLAGGAAQLRVRDTGIGIHEDLIGQVFEPFTQAYQGLDRGRGGLGLGLAVVKTLVELHAGTVSIASPGLGGGTTVDITLPITVGSEHRATRPEAVRVGPRRVLIIGDQRDTANALRAALSLRGHDVHVAYDGPSGIDAARELRPEVVFCDIGLPGMDGYAVARTLRDAEGLRDLFLVALTGYAQPDDIERARQAGFELHLAKPATIEDLEGAMASARCADSAAL